MCAIMLFIMCWREGTVDFPMDMSYLSTCQPLHDEASPTERYMDTMIASRIEKEFGKGMTDLSGLIPAIYPRTVGALSDFLGFASREKARVMLSGGGTLPEPVLIDDTVRLSLARMDRVLDVHAGDSVVLVEAGAIADHAVEAAGDEKLLLALDPSSGARSTVGGAYMTAAMGPYASGYGPFRDAVIGVKCVTASGDTVMFGGRTMKNVTGFEMTRFLAGSHGIFAVAAELTVKAFPLPEKRIDGWKVRRSGGTVFGGAAG